MSQNIFQIEQEYLSIIAEIEELDGELTEELQSRLAINEESRTDKIQAYVNIIKLKQGEVKTIQAEIERLSKVEDSKQKTIERLKNTLLQAVKLFGEDGKTGNKQLQLETQKLYTQASKSLEIDDMEASQDEELLKLCVFNTTPVSYAYKLEVVKQFPNFVFTPKYDKAKIKELILKEGKEFKGCGIVTKETIRGL